MLSLFIPLAWLRVDLGGVTLTAAHGVRRGAAASTTSCSTSRSAWPCSSSPRRWSAWGEPLSPASAPSPGWTWFAVLFVGGWILQLVGHVFEGRKPALADNLFQIFVAPIFLCAEVFFALGYKPRLHAAVQERALRMRARG